MEEQTLMQCFYDMLAFTIGVVPHDKTTADPLSRVSVKAREAAMDLEQMELYDNPADATDSFNEIAEFERREAIRKRLSRKPSSSGTSWSPEAELLLAAINEARRKKEPVRPLTKRDYVLSQFRDVRLPNLGVTELDCHTIDLQNLERLNISGNKVSELTYLPPSLHALFAYANNISVVEPVEPLPNALHMGLGYNFIRDIEPLVKATPSLVILDVAYNALDDLSRVVGLLSTLPLRHVFLFGNPLSLSPGYRIKVVNSIPTLQSMDGLRVTPEYREEMEGQEDSVAEVEVQNREAVRCSGMKAFNCFPRGDVKREVLDTVMRGCLGYFHIDELEVSDVPSPEELVAPPEETPRSKGKKGKGKYLPVYPSPLLLFFSLLLFCFVF